jgi:nitrite reductase/ring-hydroxylating ferredoxin subunit
VAATRERETRLPAAQAPALGEIRIVEVGGHRIGVFNVDGQLHALADRCPHRAGPLCSHGTVASSIEVVDGELAVTNEKRLVRCPWHKWDFEIATGRCAVDPRLRVRRYAVRSEGDEIVVSLDAPAD